MKRSLDRCSALSHPSQMTTSCLDTWPRSRHLHAAPMSDATDGTQDSLPLRGQASPNRRLQTSAGPRRGSGTVVPGADLALLTRSHLHFFAARNVSCHLFRPRCSSESEVQKPGSHPHLAPHAIESQHQRVCHVPSFGPLRKYLAPSSPGRNGKPCRSR